MGEGFDMDAEQTVRDFMSAVTADIAAAADYLADDFSVTGMAPAPIDRTAFLEAHDGFNRAMPDRRFILSGVQSEGNKVTALVGLRGTHTGVMVVPIPGVEPVQPTHRQIDLPPTLMAFILHEGKIASIHADPSPESGLAGLMKQIGVTPPG
jgi:hypothetical protein